MLQRRIPVIVLMILCLGAAAASTASPAAAEQRAYLCTSSASFKEFSDAHCVNNVGFGSFGHSLISGTASITFTNAKTASSTTAAAPFKINGVVVGVTTEIECSTVGGSGSVANAASPVSGELGLSLSGCVAVKPAGKGCTSTITLKPLVTTTAGQAANTVKFSPVSGNEIGSLTTASCLFSVLNGTFPITGSFIASATGATLTATHASITTQNTLKLAGAKAGFEFALTPSAGDPVSLT